VTDVSTWKGNNNLRSHEIEEKVEVKRQKIQEGRPPLDGEPTLEVQNSKREPNPERERGNPVQPKQIP